MCEGEVAVMQKEFLSSYIDFQPGGKKLVLQTLLYACWQRSLDGLFVLIMGVVFLCLFPVIALCIYCDSRGPLFYTQERVGYLGKKFRIIKFRSMRTDAEATGEAVWAVKNDTRVTRIGRFLRSTHLDELPQLINIVKGDMHVIGPRPERPEFVTQLEQKLPFYQQRHSMKPGLTGWAQVKYRYASTDDEAREKLHYDLFYVYRRSVYLDIAILLRTVREVICHQGR